MSNKVVLNVKGLKCPLPILKAKKGLAELETGDVLSVLATDKGAPGDFESFCKHTGHEIISIEETEENNEVFFTITVKHK